MQVFITTDKQHLERMLQTFDLEGRVHKANLRNLYKAGALVRISARRIMRRSKKSSKPGKPPKAHLGTLKKTMRFQVNQLNESVAIGPIRQSNHQQEEWVPAILEHGGYSTILVWAKKERMLIAEEVYIEARPYMRPAEEKVRDRYPEFWKDSVT